MFKIFKKIFAKSKAEVVNDSKESRGITKEMVYSLRDGIRLSNERNYEAAIIKFDMAIETGIFNEAYRERGYCFSVRPGSCPAASTT